MFRFTSILAAGLSIAAPAAAVEINFDTFDSGTLITDQYSDFTVSLEGTDLSASTFKTTSYGVDTWRLINNPEDSNSGFPLLIDFADPVYDLKLTLSSVNGPGTLEFTTDSFLETLVLDYTETECRITYCDVDLSGFGDIYDLRLAFSNVFRGEVFSVENDAFGLFSMSYSLGYRDEPTDPEMNVVPLPASGLLLLAGLGGVAALRRRKT